MKLNKIITTATIAISSLAVASKAETYTLKFTGIVNQMAAHVSYDISNHVQLGDVMTAYYYFDSTLSTQISLTSTSAVYRSNLSGGKISVGDITLHMSPTDTVLELWDNHITGSEAGGRDGIVVSDATNSGTFEGTVSYFGTSSAVLVGGIGYDLMNGLTIPPDPIIHDLGFFENPQLIIRGANKSTFDQTFVIRGVMTSYTIYEGIYDGTAIPEPGTYAAIAGVACLGMAAMRRRRKIAA